MNANNNNGYKSFYEEKYKNMKNDHHKKSPNLLLEKVRRRLQLKNHIDASAAVKSIKSGQTFRGPNVYILVFAIVIASVGLNVNSIPVIIGAMLISPLMGPIVGVGLSLGINDFRLLKSSLKNLFAMVMISIVASTMYFALSPLKLENPTELLARTNPTIYDVLIALFGGLAGILETCRKEKGTVMSGVAIATALMPPLCTIGYGIASLNPYYALGALYLFFINGVFISLAAFAGVKYLGFKSLTEVDPVKERKNRRRIGFAIMILIIPSIFSAINVVKQNNFERNVNTFLKVADNTGNNFIYDFKINHNEKPSNVVLYIANRDMDSSTKETLYLLAAEQGIKRSQIQFNTDMANNSLKTDKLAADIIARSESQLANKDSIIDELTAKISNIEDHLLPYKQLDKEIKAQYPNLKTVSLTQGATIMNDSLKNIVIVQTTPTLTSSQKEQLSRWLNVRLNVEDEIIIN